MPSIFSFWEIFAVWLICQVLAYSIVAYMHGTRGWMIYIGMGTSLGYILFLAAWLLYEVNQRMAV